MKEIYFKPEKREKVLNERKIDMEIIAHMIKDWQFIRIMKVPSRPYQNMYVINYWWYACCVPFNENDDGIELKTAYFSRKINKFLNLNLG